MAAPFDSRELIGVARSLAANGDEASLRSAVNRAYYGLFIIARDRLGITGQDNIHGRVISALRGTRRGIGDGLRTMRTLREEADYQMAPSDPALGDWGRNWTDAEAQATRLLPMIETL